MREEEGRRGACQERFMGAVWGAVLVFRSMLS